MKGRMMGWFWSLLDRFLAGLVDRHFDNEGARRRKPITREDDGD